MLLALELGRMGIASELLAAYQVMFVLDFKGLGAAAVILQGLDFLSAQLARHTRGQVAQLKGSDAHTLHERDGVVKLQADVTQGSRQAFVGRDAQDALVARGPYHADALKTPAVHGIVKRALYLRGRGEAHFTPDREAVTLRHLVARVSQDVRHAPVIGHEHQAAGALIEAAHRKQARMLSGNDIRDELLGFALADGHTLGLVGNPVAALRQAHTLAID